LLEFRHFFVNTHVCDVRCGNVFRTPVTELQHVAPAEKMFPRTQQTWGNGKVYLVDESRDEILSDSLDTTSEYDVSALGRLGGEFESAMDAIRDELKSGSSVHFDRWSGMVGQHENWDVKRWIAAPPPLPCLVGAKDL
jgi:hypothetical protein